MHCSNDLKIITAMHPFYNAYNYEKADAAEADRNPAIPDHFEMFSEMCRIKRLMKFKFLEYASLFFYKFK